MKLYRKADLDGPIPVALNMPPGVVGIMYVYELVRDAVAYCGPDVELMVVRYREEQDDCQRTPD